MGVSLGELATRFGCEFEGDPERRVARVATLANAGPDCVSFFANPAYRPELAATDAGCVIVRPAHAGDCPVDALLADDPYLCYARIAAVLHPPREFPAGVHSSAAVDPSSSLGDGSCVAANASVGAGCDIGARVYIGPGCVVDDGTRIGDDSRLLANCAVLHGVTIGRRCIIHPGAVIGSDGFGNAKSAAGWVKVPQVGSVRIGDDVEVGANTTIDRGAIDDTVIGNGVRLDNLVQIAHNVRIGEHTAIASQSGIAGSTTIGKRCMFAGQSGAVGHVTICDDVVVGGMTMVSKDIRKPGFYTASFPAEPDREWKRRVARFRRLDNLAHRVSRLEKGKSDDDE